MRQKWLALFLCVILFFPVTVYAQAPTPPPSLAEICYPEGKFHPVECAKAVWSATGLGGIFMFVLIFLFGYLVLTPGGKALQLWVQDNVGEWLRSFSKPTPAAEIQRREAEYLLELEKSEALRQPDEIASQFDAYLNTLHAHENPLRPSEDFSTVQIGGKSVIG